MGAHETPTFQKVGNQRKKILNKQKQRGGRGIKEDISNRKGRVVHQNGGKRNQKKNGEEAQQKGQRFPSWKDTGGGVPRHRSKRVRLRGGSGAPYGSPSPGGRGRQKSPKRKTGTEKKKKKKIWNKRPTRWKHMGKKGSPKGMNDNRAKKNSPTDKII